MTQTPQKAPDAKKAPEAPKSDGKWKNKDAVLRRVFRVLHPPMNESLYTLNRLAGMVNGTTFPAKVINIAPNHAQQYILDSGAEAYKEQLAAMREYEKLGVIAECAPSEEGVTWIPDYQKEINELEAKLAKAKMAAPSH